MAPKRKQSLYRWMFHRSRGDSPFTKSILHIVLIVASLIMIYPALRVLTISLRPGNKALSTSLDIIPTDRLMVPQDASPELLNRVRERTPDEVMAAINKSDMMRAESKEVTYKFSGTKATIKFPTKYTDFDIEKVMYRNEQDAQVLLDAEIRKGFTNLVPLSIFINGGYNKKELSSTVINADQAKEAEALKDQIIPVEAPAAVAPLPGAEPAAPNAMQVTRDANPAYQFARDNNYFEISQFKKMEVVYTDTEILLKEVLYSRNEPIVNGKEILLPSDLTWNDIVPFVEAQKKTNEEEKKVGFDGKAVILVNGKNLVPSDYLVPWNIDIERMQKQILYQKANVKEYSYVTASGTNYAGALFGTKFLLWIWNSLLITVSTAFLGVALASTSAYAFSRFQFPGRRTGLIFLLATQMIPSAMLILPIYLLATQLGLIGEWTGLVVAYSVGSIPFSIHILKGYYDTIPKELEEAATIDGATKMQTFFRIMLPLAAPALAIVFLFNFMQAWNDFLLARIMLNESPDRHTWPLGLQKLQGQFTTDWGKFSAAALMVSVPVTILFLASSKYLVSGLTLGSVKG